MAGEVMLNAFCPDLQDFCVLTLDLPLKSRAIQKELKDAWGDRSFTIHSVPTQVHLPETPDPLEIWRALLPHNPHIFLQVTPTVLKALGNVDDLNQERVHLIIRTIASINAFDMGAGKTILMEGSPKERLCNILPQTLKDYQLYKVSDGMKLEPDVQLRVRLSALDLSQFQPLNTVLPVQDLSPWGFVPGYLHLLLMPQDSEEGDIPRPLRSFAPRKTLTLDERQDAYFARPVGPPSSEAKVLVFHNTQSKANPEKVIYCGRPYEASTPPSLLDETLAQLRHDICHAVPTAEDFECFQSLREVGMKTYVAEEPRRAAFSTALSQGGILPTYPVAGGIGTVHTDGDLRVKCLDALPLYYIQEIKLDLSTGGAEPFTEAVFYYDCGIRDMYENKSFVFSKEVRRKMNFPAVLVLHVGPYLCVAAAVFTDRPIVEHLASVPLHAHSTNVEEHDRGRRVLAALRKAVNSLQERYPDIHDKRGPDAEYPFRDFYEDSEKNKHYFTYLTSIEDKRVFRAKLVTQGSDEGEHGQPVIVKFSTRYSEDAHRAAHKIGLAPKLYAVNDVYGWQMVVMEDESADWTTLYDLMRYKRHGDWIQWVGAEVEAKLSLLHQQGFVHGDVRDVNMLLRRNMDQDDDPRKILLVDWDWAGTIHNASYPPNINRTDIARPAGARAGARITPAHDLWMAERLCTG